MYVFPLLMGFACALCTVGLIVFIPNYTRAAMLGFFLPPLAGRPGDDADDGKLHQGLPRRGNSANEYGTPYGTPRPVLLDDVKVARGTCRGLEPPPREENDHCSTKEQHDRPVATCNLPCTLHADTSPALSAGTAAVKPTVRLQQPPGSMGQPPLQAHDEGGMEGLRPVAAHPALALPIELKLAVAEVASGARTYVHKPLKQLKRLTTA